MITLHTSPLGQKLLGSSALGSQSQPRGRHLHWTQLWSAEQVESSAEALGSPEQVLSGGNLVTTPAILTITTRGELGCTAGRCEAFRRIGDTNLTKKCVF